MSDLDAIRPAHERMVHAASAAYERRAEVRRRLRHANTDVRALLTVTVKENRDVARLPVRVALADLPGMSRRMADSLMGELGIAADARLGALSRAQVASLVDRLDP